MPLVTKIIIYDREAGGNVETGRIVYDGEKIFTEGPKEYKCIS